MKSSICLIGQNRLFTKSLAYAFANFNDLYYVDVDEMIKFDLIDVVEAKRLCGVDYIDKVTAGRIKNISTYENTVFTLENSNLNIGTNLEVMKKNALVIYIDLPKRYAISKDNNKGEIKIEKETFKYVTEHYKSIADIVVPLKNKDIEKSISLINIGIAEFYKKH